MKIKIAIKAVSERIGAMSDARIRKTRYVKSKNKSAY